MKHFVTKKKIINRKKFPASQCSSGHLMVAGVKIGQE